MKKAILLTAICALALCSCSKSDEDSASQFGKAEIKFDMANADYKGAPSENLFQYFTFTVDGTDFEGRQIHKTLDANNLSYSVVCDKTPTATSHILQHWVLQSQKRIHFLQVRLLTLTIPFVYIA